MNTTRSCGCKGYRSCLACEKELRIDVGEPGLEKLKEFRKVGVFCPRRRRVFFDDDDDRGLEFPGVVLLENFVTEAEEERLLADLDGLAWSPSQSGRRKQNFGPKANFKKRKLKLGREFRGFPECTRFVQERFDSVAVLRGFRTVEQCSIEYRPDFGACIEPHVDDCWIWGERIVQLNMASDSSLTAVPFRGPRSKYNLVDVETYPRVVDPDHRIPSRPYAFKRDAELLDAAVRIPLPRRSLLLLYGEPRYQWEHFVLRSDITSRRVIIAYRELTPPYLPGGREEAVGAEVLKEAAKFWTQ